MSRIGNRILTVPSGVTLEIQPTQIKVSGNNETIMVAYDPKIIGVEQKDGHVTVTRKNELKETKMLHGTVNANLNNALIGLTKGFEKTLILKGVGYKAKVEGSKLNMTLGFSHPVILDIPRNIKVETPSATEIKLKSSSKEAVGQFCAVIRTYRMPEPYKGKGILFDGEKIIRKAGKTADKK